MPTTAQLYTITRDSDGRYRIVDARGEPVRDGLGIVSFARAAAAADYCAYFEMPYRWDPADWPGLIQEER